MKRILKGFLSIALLFTIGQVVASCGVGGCGSSVNATTGLTCGACGISGTQECITEQCNDECERFRCCGDNFYCHSHFSPRSQGLDGARRLAGVTGTHLFDKDEVYINADVSLAFYRNFNTPEIGKFLSPNCGSNCFTIGADQQSNVHLRSHDFGFEGTATICLCPRASSFVADFNFFVGLNEWLEGLFLELQVPVVYTSWEPRCCVTQLEDGLATFRQFGDLTANDTGLMSTLATSNGGEPANTGTISAKAALQGGFTWGDLTSNLCRGRICCDKQNKLRMADLRMRLGYDFYLKENYHVGLKAIVAAPTGNKAEARFLWEPIAGNGGHWELGGGLTTHAVIWDKDENKSFAWYLDAEVTHMFKTGFQKRTFDLAKNGCFSRYLLLKRFTDNGNHLALAKEGGALERGPDVFTQDVKVRVDIQADITSFLRIMYNNYLFDFGYNGWFRGREKLLDLCCVIPDKTYAIKGELPLSTGASSYTADLRTASAATISDARNGNNLLYDSGSATAVASRVFVTCKDLDICGGSHPATSSHSVFAHLGYHWTDIDWEPVLGVGGKAEFSGRGNTAFDQWAIWAKGSVSF